MKILVYFVILITLLLSACTSATEFPISTSTINPSVTSTITPNPNATAMVAFSATTNYTPTAVYTQVSWYVCEGAEEPLYKKDLSPNGEWISVACDPHDPSKFNGAKIVQIGGDLIWDVSFYDIYGIFQNGMRDGQVGVTHWTKDGNYVFLRPYFCCADALGNIFFNYFNNAPSLHRLDLRTGEITTTLQPFKGNVFAGYNVAFSPTDKYLTYVSSDKPRDVNIYNLQTGEMFTVTVDSNYAAGGKFSWSQDGNKAVFVAIKPGWSYYDTSINDGVSYFLLDLKTESSIHLFDKQELHWVSWTQDGNIILHNVSGTDGLLYNLQNNNFTVVTSTPAP